MYHLLKCQSALHVVLYDRISYRVHINSMYVSPSRNMPHKKIINFVKTVSSPRQHTLSSQASLGRRSGYSLLALQITFGHKLSQFTFPYSHNTTIAELITFIEKQLGHSHIYLKSGNNNIDYLLTLCKRTIEDLNATRLQMSAWPIKVSGEGNMLNCMQIVRCIGTGGFSRVYLARGWGKLVALKVIDKQYIVQNEKENIIDSQRVILEKCRGHPFITQLYASFQTKNNLIFCMEYCNGGELFNLLRKVKRMRQDQAKFYFLQTLAALQHLHQQQILYRDLKPENIIIDSDGHIRLADYGLSKIMDQPRTYSFCGSAQYMAPQMLLKKGHSFEIDYYCLGALLYELVTGLPPYYSRDQKELFDNIIKQQLQFPPGDELSKELRKILKRLLQKDIDLRFKKISQIMAHPWLKDSNMQDVLAKKIEPPFRTDMYANNFDDADFAMDQQSELRKLDNQKHQNITASQKVFKNFDYFCPQFAQIEKKINEINQPKLNFSKKPTYATQQQHFQQKQPPSRKSSMGHINLINSSIRKMEQSKIVDQDYNHPNRYSQPMGKSIQKDRNGYPYNPHLYGFTPSLSNLSSLKQNKPSSIVDRSYQTSKISNNSASILTPAKRVSQPQKLNNASFNTVENAGNFHFKPPVPSYTRPNEHLPSPININNYINIYTQKQQPPLNFNPNFHRKASGNYKSINSSQNSISYNNYSLDRKNPSLDRNKFSSLDKPIHQNSSGFLKNNVYFQPPQVSAMNNFKDKFVPVQKIKKSLRSSEKINFNINMPMGTAYRY